MKLFRIPLIAIASLVSGLSLAADGTLDRSTEIAKYSEIMTSGTRATITLAAKDIYVSGLSDPGLARLVREQLLRNQSDKKIADRSQNQYELWLLKALASFGLAEDKETLKLVRERSHLSAVRAECQEELQLIDWHRGKNAIMAGLENYRPDMDTRVVQLLNLLKAEDFTYKLLAAERISWEKRLDPVLLDEIAVQLPVLAPKARDRSETKVLGLYAKLLGYSENRKYLPMLESVIKVGSSMLVEKHASEAIKRINAGVRQ